VRGARGPRRRRRGQQGGALGLARPNLAHPVCCDRPMAVGGGALQADARGFQVLPALPVWMQGARTGAPAPIVAPGLQPGGQPVGADSQGVPQRPGAGPQGVPPGRRPGGDVVAPRLACGAPRRQPAPAHPPQAPAHPVARGGKLLVHHGLEPHALPRRPSQGHLIATCRRQGQGLGHRSHPLLRAPPRRPPLAGVSGASRLMTDGSTASARNLTTMLGTAPHVSEP
jgi:hypothetical protein